MTKQPLCLLPCQCQHPPTSTHDHANLPLVLLSLSLWPPPLLMTHLQMKQPQMNKGDLAGRSGKQMFDLMDQLLRKRGNSYHSEAV